jgi:cyclase
VKHPRLVFTLLHSGGSYMLSRNFRLQTVGGLAWLREFYDFDSMACAIDELVVLDVGRTDRSMPDFCGHLRELTSRCFMPVSAGGGIRAIGDAEDLFRSGVDKIVVNTGLDTAPDLVKELVQRYGSQAVVGSIDFRTRFGSTETFVENGTRPTGTTLDEAAGAAVALGVGELYLTSIDKDGTGQGYEVDALRRVCQAVSIPVIASGGVGKFEHLLDGIVSIQVDGVSTANLFNFMGEGLADAREALVDSGLPLPFHRPFCKIEGVTER